MNTLGDHLEKRRLDLGLEWKQVAKQLGTVATNVALWRSGRTKPGIRFWPAIIRFLRYDPRPPAQTVGTALRRYRAGQGVMQEDLARQLRIDTSTLARWEREDRAPSGVLLKRVLKVLADSVPALNEEQLHSLGGDPRRGAQNVGERLVRYRIEHRMSQRSLAKLLGVNPNTIVIWELNRRVPKGEFLARVNALLTREHGELQLPHDRS